MQMIWDSWQRNSRCGADTTKYHDHLEHRFVIQGNKTLQQSGSLINVHAANFGVDLIQEFSHFKHLFIHSFI